MNHTIKIAAIAALLTVTLSACDSHFGPAEIPKFKAGQMVKMKAFGHEAMVIAAYCPESYKGRVRKCTYSLRFSAMQLRTDVRLFGKDGAVDFSPIATVDHVREFEIVAQ